VNKQAQDLNAKVLAAQKAYYNGEDAGMTDAEFDVLEAQLRALDPTAPALQKPGSSGTGRVNHDVPMLSIENKYTEKELTDWCNSLGHGVELTMEPKFDGISVSLKYRKGKLVQALTRGDGESGEDITANVRACNRIPQVLKESYLQDVEIRGELVMKNITLERINSDLIREGKKVYASTRNLTAGTMKTSDLKVVASREIECRAWDLVGDDTKLPLTGTKRLELLFKEGFPAPRILHFGSMDNRLIADVLKRKLEERETVLRAQDSLETDGVVIKVDDISRRKKLGLSSKYTNYQVCFKPQSASGTTTLMGVTWQMGRQGKLTPVAEVAPLTLAGAVVQRASLNNITWINNMGLKMGAKIEVLRSGDVIPVVVRAIDTSNCAEIQAPSHCPECTGKITIWTDPSSEVTTHWCTNEYCPGRLRDYFTFIADRDCLEIDNLGPEMAVTILKNKLAFDLGELFGMQGDFEQIRQAYASGGAFERLMNKYGFSVANVTKMLVSMEKAKTADWDRWICALGINFIGRSLGKVIAKQLKLDKQSIADLPGLFANFPEGVEGIGEKKLEELRNWGKTPLAHNICKQLAENGVKPTAKGVAVMNATQSLTGVTFVITGEFGETRDTITAKLESLGAKSQSGVSKKTQLLIVGAAAGKSKLTKATELGTKQVGAEFLIETFAAAGISFDAGDFEPSED
jgi:DNA ligase (NAD+)